MSIKTLVANACRVLGRFGRSQRGNVAVTFAFATLPLIGFVGAAVDYSRANTVKTSMQAALDTVALMLSKEAASDTTAQLQANAQKYFAALFTRPEAQNAAVTASYSTTGGSTIVVNGSASVPTTFMGVLGFKSFDVSTSSTAKWGSTRLRVALVLDNTGSMADDGKIAALKTATTNLLTQLKSAAGTNGDVYVSIIPFVKDVAVDTSAYDSSWENWIDWSLTAPANSTPDSSVGPGSDCPYSSYSNGFSCATTPGGSTTTSTIPTSGTYAGYICPSKNSLKGCYTSVSNGTTTQTVSSGYFASCNGYSNCSCSGSNWNKVCTQTVTTYTHRWVIDPTKWNGCFTDRGSSSSPGTSAGHDQDVATPTTSDSTTLFPAEQYSSCPQPMMGLNYNWTAMQTLVNNMVASGNTNQPIGLVWGWQSLAGGGPFTAPPMDPNYTYQQIIILMSDGLNTQDRWYTSQNSIDNRMYYSTAGTGTCANIKAAGITIYTIQVNTGGDPTSTLLKNCASDSSKFYLLTSASAMITTFNAIGTQLTQLRVAK
ncbi:MAG TPA: TadE/TadG family type IV pilus assembly protein [Pseudolabrys sp.]|nr:TadE/TadG family type IV pilus assembly protein [Pseudolabrys sp.]